MSCSLWQYEAEMCDNRPCPGDCDFCNLWEEVVEDDE